MKQVQMRPNLRISTLLTKHREELSRRYTEALREQAEKGALPSYGEVGYEEHRWNHRLILRNLINAIRTRDRAVFLAYCEDIAERRWGQGFGADELCGALDLLNQLCLDVLSEDSEAADVAPYFYDHITVTIRFGTDHVQEVYELMDDERRRADRSGPVPTIR
jgi:hypothetical protein